MSNKDMGNVFVEEDIPDGSSTLYKIDHRLVYLSEYSKEKNNPVDIYVVYTKTDLLIKGNWNEFAKQVYEASNLKDRNAILITVPYNKISTSSQSATHYMPGVYAKGIDIRTSEIPKVKASTSSLDGYNTYQSIISSQVTDFIFNVYKQTYKPYVIYLGLRYADGTIQPNTKESEEYEPGYNFVKTVLLKNNIYFTKIEGLTKPEPFHVYAGSTGGGNVPNYNYEFELLDYEIKKAEFLDEASKGNIDDWESFSNSIDFKEKQLDQQTAYKYITGYAYKSGFNQWVEDLSVVYGGTDENPPVYEFANTYNKDGWSTVDPIVYGTIDVASILASFVAADAIPEAIGLMYSVKRNDMLNASIYTSAIVLPVLASGELRAGQVLARKLATDSKIFFRGLIYTVNTEGKLAKVSTTYTRGRLLEFFKLSDNSVSASELDNFITAFKNKKITNEQIKSILSEADNLRVAKFKGVANQTDIISLIVRWDNLTMAEAKSLYTQLAKTEIKGSKVVRTQAEILQDIQQRGLTNPYSFAFPIEDFKLTDDAFFVRAYNQYKTGRWMIAIDDVHSFNSVDDFIKKTALPVVDEYGGLVKPNKMVIVRIPKGTVVRKSIARPQDWGGQGHLPGGAIQYEIIDLLGQKYDDGLKVIVVNAIEDSNLKQGEEIISRIIKPLVKYNGEQIQAAQVDISIGI